MIRQRGRDKIEAQIKELADAFSSEDKVVDGQSILLELATLQLEVLLDMRELLSTRQTEVISKWGSKI